MGIGAPGQMIRQRLRNPKHDPTVGKRLSPPHGHSLLHACVSAAGEGPDRVYILVASSQEKPKKRLRAESTDRRPTWVHESITELCVRAH